MPGGNGENNGNNLNDDNEREIEIDNRDNIVDEGAENNELNQGNNELNQENDNLNQNEQQNEINDQQNVIEEEPEDPNLYMDAENMENLNINQELNRQGNNQQNNQINAEQQRFEQQAEEEIRRLREEHERREREARERREQQNRQDADNNGQEQENEPLNELEQEQQRAKEQKREEIKAALLEVEKALSEPPDPNAEDPLVAQGIKVYGALDKLETLVNDNPGVCPEFDAGWSNQLQARMDQQGFFAAEEFVNTMKNKLGIANAIDVNEAERGNINPDQQQNVNEQVNQAEQILQKDPRKHYLVLRNPEEDIEQAKPNELEEIKKQRELLQLEMEKLRVEQEKLRLERERLEALRKKEEEKKKKQAKEEPDEPEIPEKKEPEKEKPVKKTRKINTRMGIFNEVDYKESLTRGAADDSTKLFAMVKYAPVRGKVSKEFSSMYNKMDEFNRFMQKIKGRTMLSAEEMRTYDRLSMAVIRSSEKYSTKKEAVREERINREDREYTTKKFKSEAEKQRYMNGYNSKVEEDRDYIAQNVREGVEKLRQKMFEDAIKNKIKEMQEKCDMEVAKAEDERKNLSTQNLSDKELHDTMENNIAQTEFFSHRMKSIKPEDLTVKPGESLGQALGRLDSYLVPRPKDLKDIKGNKLTKELVDEGIAKTRKGEVLTNADMEKAEKREIQNQAQPIINQRHREENIRPVNRQQPEQERRLELGQNQPGMH